VLRTGLPRSAQMFTGSAQAQKALYSLAPGAYMLVAHLAACITQFSCTVEKAPMRMLLRSPRTTAPCITVACMAVRLNQVVSSCTHMMNQTGYSQCSLPFVRVSIPHQICQHRLPPLRWVQPIHRLPGPVFGAQLA
jgi:hypothetical protein